MYTDPLSFPQRTNKQQQQQKTTTTERHPYLTIHGAYPELAETGGGGGRGDGVEKTVVLVAVRGRHAQHVLTYSALLGHVGPVQAVREHRLVVVHVQHLDVQLEEGKVQIVFNSPVDLVAG